MSDQADHSPPTTQRNTLFVTDAELIRRLGVPEKTARAAIRELERQRGFPRRNSLMGNRRYWPAVVAYFHKQEGLASMGFSAVDGEENWT